MIKEAAHLMQLIRAKDDISKRKAPVAKVAREGLEPPTRGL